MPEPLEISLASFVPAALTRRAAIDITLLQAPDLGVFPAAVMFADISGFTRLSERLAKQGPLGAEKLTEFLNGYFGKLIELVLAHGGDVVKFAGDALLAVWRSPDLQTSLADATLLAAQCGLAMQEALKEYKAGEVSLTLRISIGAGQAIEILLGSAQGRQEYLLTGWPVVQAFTADRCTQPGDVVLTSEAHALIADACVGETFPKIGVRLRELRRTGISLPQPPLLLTPSGERALQPYVPTSIRARLHALHDAWLAELRPVTVLFINLPALPFTASLEEAQTVLCALEAELSHFEASINKLSADDKGTLMLAALGLPPLAHEDDPVRGVRAALAASDCLREYGWNCSIGIATGRVFCGVIGNAHRREYTLIGDTVNLAARLMQSAENEIFCDEVTYRATRDSVPFDTLPKIVVKGKTEPIAIFRPRSSRLPQAPLRPESALVGRKQEIASLQDRLEALQAGKSSIVFLEGEPGIGKSRLIDKLQEMANARAVRCLKGEADSIEQRAYFAWQHIFARLLNLEALSDGVARQQQALEQLGADPEAGRFAPLLNDALTLDLSENEVTATLTGPARSSRTIQLLCHLLQVEATRSPLLVILEDVHWMDSVSWALALRVAQTVSPVMFVLTTRPLGDTLSEERHQLLGASNAIRLTLDAIANEDVTKLVCSRLGVETLPRPVTDLIQRKAEGNPLFSEELAFALRDLGFIEVSEGRCRLTRDERSLHEFHFPDTVQGIITSRIDRLTPQQQLLIKIASVIGREFTLQMLHDIHPISEDRSRLQSDLDVLARLGLTPLIQRSPETSYLFKHAITQEVAYNLMLFAQRQQLHTAVAAWVEKAFADDLAAHYAILAYHWTRAVQDAPLSSDRLHRAIEFCQKAGEQAMQVHAPIEAITHLTNALQVLSRLQESVERSQTELALQTLVAVALTLTRGWASPAVGHAFQRAYELCQQLDDSPQHLPILSGVLTFNLVGGQFRKAFAMGEQHLRAAERFEDPKFILEAEQDLGASLFYMGQYQEAVPHFQRASSLYDPQNHSFHVLVYGKDTRAVALLHESLCAWCLGFPNHAIALAQTAVAQTEQKNHPFSHLWALASYTVILQMRGELESMQPLAHTLLTLSTERGYPNWIAQSLTYLGWTRVCQGQEQIGIQNMEEGVALWHSTGSQLLKPYLMYLLADGHARIGNKTQALQVTNAALALVSQTEETWWQPELLRLKGEILLTQDVFDPIAAESHFQQAIGLARLSCAKSLELRAATSFTRLLLSQKRYQEARDLLEPVLGWFQEGKTTQDYQTAREIFSAITTER